MTPKMKSCVKGLLMGCCGTPRPLVPAKKEPVAWLYNGVRLPALPEWDKETYPYAVIGGPYTKDGYDGVYYSFVASDYQPELYSENKNTVRFGIFSLVGSQRFCRSHMATTAELAEAVIAGTNEWRNVSRVSASHIDVENTIWTNTDIMNGMSLFMSASDPIPVYE